MNHFRVFIDFYCSLRTSSEVSHHINAFSFSPSTKKRKSQKASEEDFGLCCSELEWEEKSKCVSPAFKESELAQRSTLGERNAHLDAFTAGNPTGGRWKVTDSPYFTGRGEMKLSKPTYYNKRLQGPFQFQLQRPLKTLKSVQTSEDSLDCTS